jgi:uncharacterized BrkB/YihY/UPF0761 family membrane protein
MEWLVMIGGVLVAQAVLVLVYAVAANRRLIKRRELVGSLLAAVLVAMWVGVLALNSVTLYAAD